MASLTHLLSIVGNVLLIVTTVSAVRAYWRTRESRHLDILLAVAVPFVAVFSRRLARFGIPLWLAESMSSAALVAAPYLFIRLVQHFRDVPLVFRRGALVFVIVAATMFLMPGATSPAIGSLLTGIGAVLLAVEAVMFHRESARSAGVTTRRLSFAAAGTWAFAVVLAFASAGSWPWFSRATADVSRASAGILFICFYIAFSTPQRLRARWLRDEEARYLSAAGRLAPEERGGRAANDLNEAAARSASNAATLVALRPAPDSSELLVRAATRPELQKLVLPIDAAVIARVVQRGPTSMSAAACGEPLASALGEYGSSVLAAPIATPSHTWGVLLVVQRPGSLFPDDDLRLLARLGGFAATALDHAQLIADARARERRAADRRLREIESRMILMLDSIKDYAMLVLDDRGSVVNWQAGAVHVFGYTADEMRDESAAPLFAATDDQLRAWLTEARQLGLATREGECRRRDGSRFLGATTIRPLETGGEDVQGFVVVARDISERRELEERLRQSQKLEAIGQLAGGVAHDFNNLLLVIAGNAELLLREVSRSDPAVVDRTSLEEIQKAAERAAGLTRQLLAFSRTQTLQSSVINLPQLVTDLLPMLRRVITEHIEVEVLGGDEVRPALGDRVQIQQVLLNLVVNARDAMPGGGRLTIRTATEWLDQATLAGEALPGPYVVLEVTDTGVGIDEATRARIFEPFFTTKPLGQGTGLGLATVYGIVKQMAGTIRVTSEPGRGSTFRVYFPETRVREAPSGQRPRVAAQLAGSETILLVEDDPAVRGFLKELLEKHGYRVLAAEHQAAALASVQAYDDSIHLVITDVVMPGGTGPELVRALAQLRPGVPALYISGYADAVLQSEATPPKASEFLQKPFSSDDLLVRIRQLVTRQIRPQ